MRRLRFLVSPADLEAGPGSLVVLPPEEGRHLRVSLRGRPGAEIHVFDGCGRGFRARIVSLSSERVELSLVAEETDPVEAPLTLVLLQALTRDEAFESAVDQATALGVSSIVPLLTERGRTGGRAPDARRLERWRRIAQEAAKLSWRRKAATIEDPIPVEFVTAVDSPGSIGLVLDTEAPHGSLRSVLDGPPPLQARIAAGPEGGFSAGERDALVRARFAPVSLGPRILRTEHAGCAALTVLLNRWGDLG